MALGDPHVMAVMASLDHLRGLTSIDVRDNRWAPTTSSIAKISLDLVDGGGRKSEQILRLEELLRVM